MTTSLFPQIKRVDEDETSKILKNVLFDVDQDHDEVKLDQIFEEFMHLTEESIHEDDEDDSDGDTTSSSDSSNSTSSSSGDDDSDSSESEDDDEDIEDDDKHQQQQQPITTTASREPTSWNLDQFIKTTIPVSNNKPAASKPSTKTTATTNTTTTTTTNTITNTTTKSPVNELPVPSPVPSSVASPTPSPVPSSVPPTKKPLLASQKPQHPPPSQQQQQQQPIQQSAPTQKQQPSANNNNFLVVIDLAKLKRIPQTKAPTPTTKAPTPTSCSSNIILTAKNLKHEGDALKDKTKQAIKYLESAMYFILNAYEIETTNLTNSNRNTIQQNQATVFGYYNDTIALLKHAMRITMPGTENHSNDMTTIKVHTLAVRFSSLLYMKLYKIKERELIENNKVINSLHNTSPVQQADSSLIGVKPQLLSAYKRQISILNTLKYANDVWQQADQLCEQHPAVRIFFSTIETHCGALTMISPVSRWMDYVKCGLKLLKG